MNFRLYIDESGTHNYSTSEEIDRKYLSLTGVIINSNVNKDYLQPKIYELKKIVADDIDDLPILHRIDIVNGKGCFNKIIKDVEIQRRWEDTFLSLISDLDFHICAVVLDKKTHLNRYQKSAQHPYHYCLDVLLERYVSFLRDNNAKGDVLAEARGKDEDSTLKSKYCNFFNFGTYFLGSNVVQQHLTSKQIKIKRKDKKIAGLEIADLLSLSTKLDVLDSYGVLSLRDNFNKLIISKINDKYYKNHTNRVLGFGKKLIN